MCVCVRECAARVSMSLCMFIVGPRCCVALFLARVTLSVGIIMSVGGTLRRVPFSFKLVKFELKQRATAR